MSDFFASYVTIPVVVLCYFVWKAVHKTRLVVLADVDLGAGPYEALQGTKYERW